MRHDNSYRRAKRSYREASMSREATMERIAGLEMKVAAMEYQAGMTDSLKGLFLKYVAEPLDKYRRHLNLFKKPVDDLIDDVIEAIAPSYAEALMEAEVDADFEEFQDGAKQRNMERAMSRGGYIPEMDPPRGKSPEFYEGYEWGDTNETPVPNSVKKRIIQEAAQEHDKKVVERALKQALNVINPIEIIKHAYHIIKENAWDPHTEEIWYKKWPKRAFKMVIGAIALAIVETIEHYVLPAGMVKLTGNPAWWGLASVPLLEILMPIVLQYFKGAKKDVVDEPGHLDWYEENYGEIEDSLKDENVFRSRSARLLDTEDLIREISQLTDDNFHTDAVVILAEHYGNRSDQDDANYVKTVHEAQGHMPRDVLKFRDKLKKGLMSKAKRVLSRSEFQELRQAF